MVQFTRFSIPLTRPRGVPDTGSSSRNTCVEILVASEPSGAYKPEGLWISLPDFPYCSRGPDTGSSSRNTCVEILVASEPSGAYKPEGLCAVKNLTGCNFRPKFDTLTARIFWPTNRVKWYNQYLQNEARVDWVKRSVSRQVFKMLQ